MTIKEAAATFEEQRKRCRSMRLTFAFLMVAGITLSFAESKVNGILIIILLAALYFGLVRTASSQYASKWREFCICLFTEKHFKSVNYSYKAEADEIPAISNHILLPKYSKGEVLARNLTTAHTGSYDVTFADVTYPVGESRKPEFISGCQMSFTFKNPIDTVFRFTKEDESTEETTAAYHLTDLKMFPVKLQHGFDDNVHAYSAVKDAELSDEVWRRLKTLTKAIHPSGIIELSPEGVFIYLPGRLINKQPPSLKYPVTEAGISLIAFPELDEAVALARCLAPEITSRKHK